MAFRITCTTCGTRFALSDDLYERKIKNRIVTIRCKGCSSDISVDGEALAATGATETPEAVNEPLLDSDAMPASAKVPDMTPTVPLQSATGGAGAETQTPTRPIETKSKTHGLWVVCCPDEEDRELTLPEIEAAIARNEVNGDAIVWRDGMAEWLPIHQVPELRVLLKKPPLPKPPKGRTLLGIGAKPKPPPAKAPVSDSDNEPVSVEPEPLSESSEMIARRKGGAVALSPGLLSVKRAEDTARPEPPPRPKLDSIPEPPPRPKFDSKPEQPARPRMDSRPDGVRIPKPPTPVRPVPKLLLEERAPDSAPDSSGTPNLRALASIGPRKPAAREDAENKPPVDDFMWGGGSAGTELLGAPTIDVAGLSSRPAAGADAEPAEAPPSSARKKATKKSRRPKPDAERRAEEAADSARAEAPPKPQAESRTTLWLVIAAAVLLVGGFLLVRGKGSQSETPPEPLPPVVEQTPPQPAAAVTAAEPAPLASAQQEPAVAGQGSGPTPASAQPREPAAEPKEPKPERGTAREEPEAVEPKPIAAEKPAATEKPEKAPEKPAASAAAGQPAEGAPSAAFDRAAANDQLKAAAGQASACRKEGDPSGAAVVVITFAPSGRVTSANVNGPPFAGTATGGCIASAMRRAKVPPFSGEHITVSKTVVIR